MVVPLQLFPDLSGIVRLILLCLPLFSSEMEVLAVLKANVLQA